MIKLHSIVAFMYSPPGTNRYVRGWGRFKAFHESLSSGCNDRMCMGIVQGIGNIFYIGYLTE